MKKSILLLTALCLVLSSFSLAFAAKADEMGNVIDMETGEAKNADKNVEEESVEIPAIDAEAAKDYLGVWYLQSMCESSIEGEDEEDGGELKESCYNVAEFGMGSSTVEFREDNTVAFGGDLEEEAEEGEDAVDMKWYYDAELDCAYILSGDEEPQPVKVALDGTLTLGELEFSMVFGREEQKALGSGEVKEDAVYEDFSGEWALYSMGSDGMFFPVSALGLDGKLVVREDSLDLVMLDEAENEIKYELKDGKMEFVSKNDATGEDQNITVAYLDDNTLVFAYSEAVIEGEEPTEVIMIFAREEDIPESNLGDLFSEAFSTVEDAMEDTDVDLSEEEIAELADAVAEALEEADVE